MYEDEFKQYGASKLKKSSCQTQYPNCLNQTGRVKQVYNIPKSVNRKRKADPVKNDFLSSKFLQL